ncbi:MAG: hypothetical protein ACFE89_01475 [Candidatus Hodarchaeota archaeon]
MRLKHFILGLFLIFFLLEFTVPTITLPEYLPTPNESISTASIFTSTQTNPSPGLIVRPSEDAIPPLPDNPLGTGRETLVEWWDTNYDYRRKITIVEPNIASRSMEPVHIYMTFTGDVAKEGIIAVAYWDLATWHEVPSQVWNATTHTTGPTTYYDSCTVCILVNITKNYQEVFYIYYDDSYTTAPSYTDYITAIADNGPITDDTTMPWVYSEVTSTNYTNVDTIFIRSSASQNESAAILLTDMLRGGSDWGGPCCGLIAARYGDVDALDTNNGTGTGTNRQYMLLGEFALDPLGQDTSMDSDINTRANVAPDNPAEAWVAGAGVWILDDGPLFTRIKIVTSDGGYSNINSPWSNQTTDTVNRGNNGATGFLNYTITYTFYWHGNTLLVNVMLDITANPQWQDAQCHVKNYGDWPHIMTFTCGSGTPGTVDAVQNRKAWNGSKYGLYNESVDGRRRDFPIEPWFAWYDDASEPGYDGTQHPTLGLIAKVNPVGWEVLSLAVTGMGDNTMLQQILREGHQGDFFIMPTGETFSYDYTVYTSAYGTDYGEVRSQTSQVNNPVSLSLGEQELYRHNILTCKTRDVEDTAISNISLYIFNSTLDLVRTGTTVSATALFEKLEDDTYTIISNYSLLSTYGGLVTFRVNTTQITLDHTIDRNWTQPITCQLSKTTVHVVDWYTNNNLATFAEVFLDNASDSMPIFALNATIPGGLASTYLLPGQYDVNIRYINRFRVHNQTTPFQVSSTTSTQIPIGVVATEHATELSLVRPSTIPYIEVGFNTTTRFVVLYRDLITGQPIDGLATPIPYVANWTLSNSTHNNIDSGLLTPVVGEPGNYSVLFDATGYLVNETYQLRILLDVNAPVDYWQAYIAIGILIRGREVQIIPESTSYSVFWNDTVNLAVYLNDTATNQPILGALPTYFGVGFSGSLLPNGTDGWYTAALKVENINQGTYTITVRAQIAAYEDATTQILLYVAPQPTDATLIDGYTSTQDGLTNRTLTRGDWWAPAGDLLVFTFNYTGMYDQLILDAIGQISYQVGFQSLEYLGNGLYRVVINTTTIPIGSYSAAVGFSKQNFEVAILSFTIEVRLIPTEIQLIHPSLNASYFEGYVTDLLRVRVRVTDTWHNLPVTNATLVVYLSELGYPPMLMYSVPGLPGVYELGGINLLREGIFDLTITATADNHEPVEFIFQLRIETHPVTRNLITFGLIAAIIGIIMLLAWVAYTRVFAIPWLVRKMRKMSTTIGKGKTPKLSGRDQNRIATRPDQMTDFMQDAYNNARISFVASAIPTIIALDEREAEEIDIWRELDNLEGLGRDQKLELFEEMKRIPPKDRIWFLEDLKRQLADGTRFSRIALEGTPEGLLDEEAEARVIQARLDALPALSEQEKKALFKQISSLPPEEREEVFETLKEQYETSDEEE